MSRDRFLTSQNNWADLRAIVQAVMREEKTGEVVPPQNGIHPYRWSALKKAVAKLGAAEAEKQFLNRGE